MSWANPLNAFSERSAGSASCRSTIPAEKVSNRSGVFCRHSIWLIEAFGSGLLRHDRRSAAAAA